MRLRLETAKQLRALGAQKKADKSKSADEKKPTEAASSKTVATGQNEVKTRSAKLKKAAPASPPTPKAKFRKRQIHKTWLPTHMFHAKRARMTAPKEPLWRFAIPLTPTAKSYRPTRRAANARGAVAWDASYISTIGLEGQQRSIEGIFKALGLGSQHTDLWGARGARWRNGTRVFEEFALEREAPHNPIAPVTVIWCVPSPKFGDKSDTEIDRRKRSVFIRVHPSAFWQLWEEIVRLAKVAKPQVHVQDLRFEIGSIEITGPAASEALHAALWPSPSNGSTVGKDGETVEALWNSLAGLTNCAMLPTDMLLGLDIQDPRLHHPPRKVAPPASGHEQDKLLELLTSWPADTTQAPAAIFDRRLRYAASSALPSQKAINRRKSLAAPGAYPVPSPKDPKIPILLFHPSDNNRSQSSFTVLLPWKCVQPVWYSLMYCPLSTGTQPRFGGLDEKRQLAFEGQQPWFPADFPGTDSGWQWEVAERVKRRDEWKRRPKSKRTNWESVDLGRGKKGEVGVGWACDWERLLSTPSSNRPEKAPHDGNRSNDRHDAPSDEKTNTQRPSAVVQLASPQAQRVLLPNVEEKTLSQGLATVRIKLLTRGVPQTCARIYRLPSTSGSSQLRRQWLTLHPREQAKKQHGPKHGLPRLPKDAPAHLVQRRLAQSLLQPPQVGDANYPACPDEEHLIGFVTTGNYNLGEGQGTGIGSIVLSKVVEDERDGKDGKLCIVRNAGNSAGRLAYWDVV